MHKVSMSVQEWADYLAAHGPRGLAWDDPDARLARLWYGMAGAFKRAHDRKLALYRDLNRNTMEDPLLREWEYDLGLRDRTTDAYTPYLPDPGAVVADRRNNVLDYIARRWEQTVPWYVALCLRFGVTVTIDKPADHPSTFRVTTAAGEWTVTRMGDCEMGDCAMGGTATELGEQVQASVLWHKRTHARVIFND